MKQAIGTACWETQSQKANNMELNLTSQEKQEKKTLFSRPFAIEKKILICFHRESLNKHSQQSFCLSDIIDCNILNSNIQIYFGESGIIKNQNENKLGKIIRWELSPTTTPSPQDTPVQSSRQIYYL